MSKEQFATLMECTVDNPYVCIVFSGQYTHGVWYNIMATKNIGYMVKGKNKVGFSGIVNTPGVTHAFIYFATKD